MQKALQEEIDSLLLGAGRVYTSKLKQYALDKESVFDYLMSIFLSDKPKVSWHAGWALFKVADENVALFSKYINDIVDEMPNMKYDSQLHGAFRIMRHFFIEDEDRTGLFIDFCFKCITDTKKPPYVKYFSMEHILKVTNQYPELLNELKATVEIASPYWTTGYICKYAKKIMAIKN